MENTMWTKRSYDGPMRLSRGGRHTITNGHLQFDVHLTIDGSHGTGYIVSPAEADAYARHIVDKLNERDSINFRPHLPQEYVPYRSEE